MGVLAEFPHSVVAEMGGNSRLTSARLPNARCASLPSSPPAAPLLQFLGEEERYEGLRAMMLVAFREVFDEFRSLFHRCGRLATLRNAGQKAEVERVEVNL